MFGNRTKGSLLHDLKIVQANSGDPEKKEVYDGNITDKTE